MRKNYIYISAGWISIALIAWAIACAGMYGDRQREETKRVAMKYGYQKETVDKWGNKEYRKVK